MTTELQPHQQRVVTERDELVKKMSDLFNFIFSGKAQSLVSTTELNDLHEQLEFMTSYCAILNKRIAAFNK